MQNQPWILMCPPDHFGIEYEINPWMSRKRPSDRRRALDQWNALRRALEEAGARVDCLTPVAGLPDLVFTANAALVCDDLAILSRFHHRQRRGEEPLYRQWFLEHGYRTHELRDGVSFEGAGDALFCGETLFAGYRVRSDIAAHEEAAAILGCRVAPLELVDRRYYHLDTCFCPLAPGVAIYYPEAFDDYGRRVLRRFIDDLIPVRGDEAGRLACNAVVIGRAVVTPQGCPRLDDELRWRGFDSRETPLDEFIKAGGAAKCLTLRLDGEEAAPWKAAIHAAGSYRAT